MTLIDQADPAPEIDMRLVADRVRVYPMGVQGPVRRFKWAVLIFCLSIYYVLPWLRWDRGPGRADQALLLDIAHERLYLLGWEFWPQEIYLLAGALILGTITLFMVTSLIGRVWCGYSCPQTVWTDLFMWVERRLEGDRNERMKRDAQPLIWDRAWRKIAKHAAWLAIAFWTGGAWIMYFADAPTVTREFWVGTAAIPVYLFCGIFTATTYLLAGWAREQVCTYMCPWPRFQSAMLDDQTLTVTYQTVRGDPRGKKHQSQSWAGRGDCVDCRACVNACPAGIDIRDGQQLECINCGLCIDACNTVMTKLDRPRWLIGWDTLERQAARAGKQKPPAIRLLRPRTIIYLAALVLGIGVMGLAVANRVTLDLSVQRDRAPLFVRLADGSLRNGYTLSLINKTPVPEQLELSLTGLPGAELSLPQSMNEHGLTLTLPAKADTVTDVRVLIHGPAGLSGSVPVEFILKDPASGAVAHYRTVFLGPPTTEKKS